MLKSWSIKNFKPIIDSGELQLAPVTVFAGRNSSGKSSLLQSILMIAQTLGSRLLDRPLLPNERLVQLGTFDDILSDLSDSRELELGFEIELENPKKSSLNESAGGEHLRLGLAQVSVTFRGTERNHTYPIGSSIIFVENSSVRITSGPPLPSGSTEDLANSTFLFKRVNVNTLPLFFKEKNKEIGELERIFREEITKGNIRINLEGIYYIGRFVDGTESDIYIPELSHFLPARVTSLKVVSDVENTDPAIENTELIIEGVISTALLELFDTVFIEDVTVQHSSEDQTSLRETASQYNPSFSDAEKKSNVDVVSRSITKFFTTQIRYLGPSRVDPGVIQQQFAPASELDDVGIKGEYAAFVYQMSKDTSIDWYNPFTCQVENDTLQVALDSWAQYLKVAEHVDTVEAGGIGIVWRIIPRAGMKPRSLPEVGTGVSKILPIFVMGLLAPANTLLIIEEPELDLHPHAQARLGDFFMGLAKCKKQCLIETHSENLVSQLRLHIVEAGGLEKSDCMIYFVDQDERGAAKFEKVEISPNGNILNWPEGFFDETMLQEDRITAASLRKRAQKAKHGS